ncbi:Tetratricopeptide-like helical [Penicillium solitum]|uniref:Tetratricopeptide-like helical n=1 Tax=Penicillium solitum TaxID=60172 RepID=UPI0032C443A2|nr:Tetratricopeptide-like helical [Penicillium solitum]
MASTSFHGSNSGLQIGVHTGPINLAPERPETPTKPLSTVPFGKDEEFVSRDVLLRQIHEKTLVPGARVALVGLGGVGKSQLAIEYSHQIRSQSPGTWVFWVHGSNESRFEQSFRQIADQVKIPGRRDPQANIFKLVENWLRDEKIGKWVCILDNVDDDQLLSVRSPANASSKPLLEYIPRSQNGSVIITSRYREAALKMVDHKGLVEVNPMEKPEALELLQRKLGKSQQNESQQSEQLVEVLEFMPLAIVQAASYIRNRAPRCSVSKYLTDFQNSDMKATKLLKEEAGHVYRDWEAKNSILVTWQISFDYIRQTKPSAADLLSLMSFFDRQGIPENLVRDRPQANYGSRSVSALLGESGDSSDREISVSGLDLDDASDEETSDSDTSLDFEDDITTLRDYSFITINEKSSFMMHRLVQLTTRAWLNLHEQIDQWKDKFISILCDEFPTGEYKNWETCNLLFPHVKSAMSQRPTSAELQRRWASLLHRGAWYAWQSGNIADTRKMATKSTRERILLLGDEHEEVISSMSILATAFRLEGRWREAEPLQVRVMETSRATLGADHPDTLTSMANLASTLWYQGRWKEAEELGVQVMETRKAKLGEDHPDTLTSISNLALTFWSQGRWNEAEPLQVWVMEMSKATLGEDHPETLRSIANLASTFWSQGRWKEAEELDVRVMETRKTKLGRDHPDTLTSVANLALTFSNQGRWKEAEPLQVQVMETSKAKLGEDHPDTLRSMANLALTFWNQGRLEEAEPLQLQVVKSSKVKLGEDHPETLRSIANLAMTLQDQGRWKEAEEFQVQVMETRKRKLGEDHPDTLMSMANLAMAFRDQGRWKEAVELQVQVTEVRKAKLGEDHPDTLMSMGNLAMVFRDQGRWKEGVELQVQVIEARKAKLGEDHPDTLISMANLAHILKSSGRDAEAIDLIQNCFAKRKQILGPDHPDTISDSKILLKWESQTPQGKGLEQEAQSNDHIRS